LRCAEEIVSRVDKCDERDERRVLRRYDVGIELRLGSGLLDDGAKIGGWRSG
jgi:predicted metalloprotease